MGGSEGQVKNRKNSDGSGGYNGEGRGGKGIHRNWISRAIIIINLIKVQTVYQAGVWFCYKCSRLMPGSAISVPDRCLVLL